MREFQNPWGRVFLILIMDFPMWKKEKFWMPDYLATICFQYNLSSNLILLTDLHSFFNWDLTNMNYSSCDSALSDVIASYSVALS